MTNPQGNRRYVVVGRPGEGKSYWIKNFLIPQYPKGTVFVVDPLAEYDFRVADVYRPTNRAQPQANVEEAIDTYIFKPRKIAEENKVRGRFYQLAVFEEASRYAPSRSPLPNNLATLNDTARHLNLDMAFCARRFSQLHTDLSELASTTIIFHQSGVNDLARCNELIRGLDEVVVKLKKYHYVQVERGEYHEMPPIQSIK